VNDRRAAMMVARRTLLAAVPAFAAGTALAFAAEPAFREHERAIDGRIGLFAENIQTGATIVWRANERFHTYSTFKASLAACVLARVDHGEDRLDASVAYGPQDIDPRVWAPVAKAGLAKGELPVAELCRAAVEESDGACANLLLRRIGGPAALTAFWRSTGDAFTRLDHPEPVATQSGTEEDSTTPAAMAGSLRRFLLGDVLSAGSREQLTGWMRNCKTGLDLLRAGLPKGLVVADKTGNGGKGMLGDIAVAWPETGKPLVIAAYIDSSSVTPREVRRLMTEIGKLIGQEIA
jgi:beta-lactamase class A